MEKKSYIYFAFDGEEFDIEEISKSLRLEPTSTLVKKDPIPKKTSWKYKITSDCNVDLETTTNSVVSVFVNKIDLINELKRKLNLNTRLQFVIYINTNPEEPTPYFPLEKEVIDFLAYRIK